MNRNYRVITTVFSLLCILASFSFSNYNKVEPEAMASRYKFLPRLMDYNLFAGKLSDLAPTTGIEVFEIATSLFADYAEKQRLIKLPAGTSLKFSGNGLPIFPEGTILVKTFFYYKDKRNPELGKIILETRLLIIEKYEWNLGTYLWNKEQTEATLINNGKEVEVDWIEANGKNKSVYYQIPSKKECSICHRSSKNDIPIGPKLRNLNINVKKNGNDINQLQYFQNIGWLDAVDVKTISALPDWEDNTHSLEERARAYLDVNCSHCHNPKGEASNKGLFLEYETPFDSTGISLKKKKIRKRLQSKNKNYRMAKLGTSVMHTEGFILIKQYIDTLDKRR